MTAKRMLAALPLLGAALLAPPLAHADSSGHPDTQAFINALSRDGINPNPPEKAIKLGYRICTALRSGVSADAVIEWLVNPPDPVPSDEATRFVTDAHAYLCPDSVTDGSWTV
jgi:hypothetical protein